MKSSTKLSEKIILKNLDNKDFFKIMILDTTSSTNTEAKKIAENDGSEGTLIIADTQTSGKGRMGRSFSSPQGCGIYMSLILKPDFAAERALLITTLAATAVSKAIENLTDKKTGIKWVNDIYIDNKKVCGILTEAVSKAHSNELKFVVLGIGINVTKPQKGFPEELKDIACSIFKHGKTPDHFRNKLIAEVLNEFMKEYPNLLNCSFLDYYREKSILTGKRVNILKCNEICGEATVLDIDDNFGLTVRYDDGKIETINSGEVSVKKKDENE
ncbi:MAG: biotin--[Clostridia bacterium]|nr:biotin--[acetyl-CoA-carboxylase] ligase [Clostridia bacterium]